MSVEWSRSEERQTLIVSVALAVVVSLGISTGLPILFGAKDAGKDREIAQLRSEMIALQGRFAIQLENYETIVREQASYRMGLASLTEENGIIDRVVAHIRTLRQNNAQLSEILGQLAGPEPLRNGLPSGVAANGLTMSGIEQSAVTEQNLASPSRLMVVTPAKKPAPEPEAASDVKEPTKKAEETRKSEKKADNKTDKSGAS